MTDPPEPSPAPNQVPREIQDAFYASQRSAAVPFVINDPVDVIAGEHAGESGSVISILACEPELLLLVEMTDGFDRRVFGRDLMLMPEG